MTKAKTCAHEGCKAPSNFIKDNGFCHAHGPGSKERLQLMGMRGGETMFFPTWIACTLNR